MNFGSSGAIPQIVKIPFEGGFQDESAGSRLWNCKKSRLSAQMNLLLIKKQELR